MNVGGSGRQRGGAARGWRRRRSHCAHSLREGRGQVEGPLLRGTRGGGGRLAIAIASSSVRPLSTPHTFPPEGAAQQPRSRSRKTAGRRRSGGNPAQGSLGPSGPGADAEADVDVGDGTRVAGVGPRYTFRLGSSGSPPPSPFQRLRDGTDDDDGGADENVGVPEPSVGVVRTVLAP